MRASEKAPAAVLRKALTARLPIDNPIENNNEKPRSRTFPLPVVLRRG